MPNRTGLVAVEVAFPSAADGEFGTLDRVDAYAEVTGGTRQRVIREAAAFFLDSAVQQLNETGIGPNGPLPELPGEDEAQ